MFNKDDSKERRQEGATHSVPADSGICQRLVHFYREMQEARQSRVYEDLTGMRYRLFDHGCDWLLHQACIHSHQQHHSVVSL